MQPHLTVPPHSLCCLLPHLRKALTPYKQPCPTSHQANSNFVIIFLSTLLIPSVYTPRLFNSFFTTMQIHLLKILWSLLSWLTQIESAFEAALICVMSKILQTCKILSNTFFPLNSFLLHVQFHQRYASYSVKSLVFAIPMFVILSTKSKKFLPR